LIQGDPVLLMGTLLANVSISSASASKWMTQTSWHAQVFATVENTGTKDKSQSSAVKSTLLGFAGITL
jgi:hypothetical protein